jgi:CPA1 family monovalent cation:H+ antiporter
LSWETALLNLVLLFVRIAWIFTARHLPYLLSKKTTEGARAPNWRHTAIVAWTGMRGVDSMAAAMALPLIISSGSPFPGRDLILFNTFAVILVTLVFQGLSLPAIIRWLGVIDDGLVEHEELQARIKAVQAALTRLNEFNGKSDAEALARLRIEFEIRMRELESHSKTSDHDLGAPRGMTYELLLAEALLAERRAILQLRNEQVINDDALRRIQRDLDLRELRLNRG